MFTRRQFITTVGALGAVLVLPGKGITRRARAQALAAAPLDPTSIPKFVTPLLIPPVMPKAATLSRRGGPQVDYYEISMRQFQQQNVNLV